MSLGKVVQEESELRNSISQLKSHREDLRASLWIIGDSYLLQLQGCNSVQFSSVTQSCLTLCDPMSCNTPGLPVHHQLPEFTQTHVHQVSDAIQPSHPLLSPSPPAPNPSQHQSLFQWVNSSHEVAKVLEFQLQHQGCNYWKSKANSDQWIAELQSRLNSQPCRASIVKVRTMTGENMTL